MKQLLISLLLAVCTLCSAQTEHMKFMGIPIDGPLENFVLKLKNKGFKHKSTEDGIALMLGEFAATRDCELYILRFSDRNKVHRVCVKFPSEYDWESLSGKYYDLKKNLTVKYGEPKSTEQFKDSVPTSDESKFNMVLREECNYVSWFTNDIGKIQLAMRKDNWRSGCIILYYLDKANEEEYQKKMMDDL